MLLPKYVSLQNYFLENSADNSMQDHLENNTFFCFIAAINIFLSFFFVLEKCKKVFTRLRKYDSAFIFSKLAVNNIFKSRTIFFFILKEMPHLFLFECP